MLALVPATGLRTGTASITVDRRGENTIVVAPGAGAAHAPDATDRALGRVGAWAPPAAVVVSQAEVPLH